MLIWKAARQNLGNTSPFFFYTLAGLFICNTYVRIYTIHCSSISIVFLNLNIHTTLCSALLLGVLFFVSFCRKTNLVKRGSRFCHSKNMVNFAAILIIIIIIQSVETFPAPLPTLDPSIP